MIVTRGYGRNTNIIGSISSFGYTIKVLVPIEKIIYVIKEFTLRITRLFEANLEH